MTASANSDSDRSTPSTDTPADLPVVDLRSTDPLPPLVERSDAPRIAQAGEFADSLSLDMLSPAERTALANFWLNGDVLMCACPDCAAPMTVRLWLMVADCWRCETSVELTEQQQRAARRLLDRQVNRVRQTSAEGSRATTDTPSPPAVAQVTYVAAPPDQATGPKATHHPLAPPTTRTLVRPRRRPAGRSVSRWLNDLLRSMPAWLISLLFHIILLTVLGLLTTRDDRGEYITLSTRLSRIVREGGDTRLIDPTDDSVYDLGVPDSIDMEDPALRRAIARADQDARQLRLIDPANPYLPDVTRIKEDIRSTSRRSLAVRDPRVRIDMVRREGGTTLTEAAVARGLRWLERHQNDDGSWSLDRFHRVAPCDCRNRGTISSDTAATSLVLLPFLGAGQTHLSGVYKDSVAQGLRWLLQQQKTNGDLRGSSRQYPGMYAHGQATIVLCEAFLMTGDEELRIPAQRAIDFIVAAQYRDGGWRYYPARETRSEMGDTSVLGWQLMALQSALAVGLSVPESTLENASNFLDQTARADGALYAYLAREDDPSAPMTAEGLLCRIYLGWKQNHPSLRAGVAWMLENAPPSASEPDIYYWYYATQTIHHFGGPQWNEWNREMRDVLVTTQETRGHAAGSWRPDGPLTSQGGRIYMTALAICCLEIYYRHLPIFRQIDLN
jgi:hypothetical protein